MLPARGMVRGLLNESLVRRKERGVSWFDASMCCLCGISWLTVLLVRRCGDLPLEEEKEEVGEGSLVFGAWSSHAGEEKTLFDVLLFCESDLR